MTYNVLTAEFLHETNTFNINKTGLSSFEADTLLIGDEGIAARGQANTGLAGCIDCSREFGWDMNYAVSAHAGPSGPGEPAANPAPEAGGIAVERVGPALFVQTRASRSDERVEVALPGDPQLDTGRRRHRPDAIWAHPVRRLAAVDDAPTPALPEPMP